MEVIKSKENKFVKDLKKLNNIKEIKKQNSFLLDNIKVINEAIEMGIDFELIVISKTFEKNIEKTVLNSKKDIILSKAKVVYDDLLSYICDIKAPQGIVVKVSIDEIKKYQEKQEKKEEQENKKGKIDNRYIILDNIQDPGNLGTIIRTMDSANIKNLIISNNCVFEYSPKVIRSTMASIFRINIIRCDLKQKIKELKENDICLIATMPKAKKCLYDVCFDNNFAIVIGNEANGISDDIINLCDLSITIPMLGHAESLNAGVASSILIYEIVRQKVKNDEN